MKDSELKIKIIEMESRTLRNLQIILETDPTINGFKSLESVKRCLFDEKKKLNKFIKQNIEPD